MKLMVVSAQTVFYFHSNMEMNGLYTGDKHFVVLGSGNVNILLSTVNNKF